MESCIMQGVPFTVFLGTTAVMGWVCNSYFLCSNTVLLTDKAQGTFCEDPQAPIMVLINSLLHVPLNFQEFSMLPTQFVHVFCVISTINNEYFPIQR
jgi:hypothetical protein